MFLEGRRRLYSSGRKEARKRTTKFILVAIFIVILISCAIVIWIIRLPHLQFDSMRVIGADSFGADNVKAFIQKEIEGNYLWFLPKSNKYIYPRAALEEDLLNTFPELTAVTVSRSDDSVLEVRVLERKPYYLWCGEGNDENRSPDIDSCYFVDIDGLIFINAPQFSGSSFFVFYGPVMGNSARALNSNKNPLGYFLLDPTLFKALIGFKNALNARGIETQRLHITEAGDYTLLLRNGVQIFLSPRGDFDHLYRSLDAALSGEDFGDEDLIKSNSRLLYLDLRFENKVYFKFK